MEVVDGVRELRSSKSLYNLCFNVITNNDDLDVEKVKYFPLNIQHDLIKRLLEINRLNVLEKIFSELDFFLRILKTGVCKLSLHRCFQTLEERGAQLAKKLGLCYTNVTGMFEGYPIETKLYFIGGGLLLGTFLSDAAWYGQAEGVLLACQKVCEALDQTTFHKILLLRCCHILLRVQALYCNLQGAELTYKKTLALIQDLSHTKNAPNLAGLYADISEYFFIRSEFDESYLYTLKALNAITPNMSAKIIVDVLRQASKAFVVKRELKKAGILSRQALDLAAEEFGVHHPKYADAQLNYGFYLLNFDSIQPCVQVYESAHNIKRSVFKTKNIHIAVALENLAYALYVREYISGRFDEAEEKANEAIRIKEDLLPHNHIMLSTARRVKALILEEIAIINGEDISRRNLLNDALKSHLHALEMTRKVYGEKSLQTAKHYGNLGRLWQSMKEYEKAEKMHLKAISLKEELLGPDHLEVGLSVGHLASLYNYHMKKYLKAKDLYLRSISISMKLFGMRYSGLEFDYRGLIHVYSMLKVPAKVSEYQILLKVWGEMKEHNVVSNVHLVDTHQRPRPILQIVEEVLNPN